MPRIEFLSDRVMVFNGEGHHVNLTYPQWLFCVAQWQKFQDDITKVKDDR